MSHALIIEDNMVISAAVQDRLTELGVTSFEQSWTEEQAVAAADHHEPDLVVVGDTLVSGTPIEAARRIFDKHDVTVFLVTGDPATLDLPASARLQGPYPLSDIETAVEQANQAADSRHFAAE